MLIISSARKDEVNKTFFKKKKKEREQTVVKTESFSLHSSILPTIDLFLKFHRYEDGKRIEKHSRRRVWGSR